MFLIRWFCKNGFNLFHLSATVPTPDVPLIAYILSNVAFHFAVKNNVPVIPNFITFKENGKKDVNGIDLYDMTVNILKPIYPNPELSPKENIKYMMAENERLWKECYEKTYGIKLEYTTIKK